MVAGVLAQVVSFKDAAKIKSWDAWNDHKKQPVRKVRRCVTWEKLNKLDPGLKVSRHSSENAKEQAEVPRRVIGGGIWYNCGS